MNLWSSEQLLVTASGPEGRREFVVSRPFARVGSHPDSEVVISGPGVAKRALYLHATSEGLFCLDLDVEDAVLEKRGRWLGPQDALRVGPYLLSARLVSQQPAIGPLPASPVAWGSATVPLPVLNVHCQRLLKDKRRFRARLNLIGRRPQCALQLRGARVSSFHCALFWDQRRLWCIDLLSSNGTQLNGAKVDFCEVRLNDRLDVGEFSLVYYRWSPRRSMQPGWQPGSHQHSDQDAEADDSAPILDAAPPPSAAAADLALASDLDDSEGSDVALDAVEATATQPARMKFPAIPAPPEPDGEPERLRRALAEADERLATQAVDLGALADRLAARERENQLAARQCEKLEAALATAERARREQQTEIQRLSAAQAADGTSAEGQQIQQLAADVARLTQERADIQSQWSESSQRFAAQIAQLNDEVSRLAQEQRTAEAGQDAWEGQRRQLDAQLAERDQQLTDLRSQLTAASVARAQRGAEAQMLAQDKEALARQNAAQMARLSQERMDLQTQWTAAAQQLTAQAEQIRQQSARLTEVRGAFDAARQEWQSERQLLAGQVAERSQQLARLEAELIAVQAALAHEQSKAAVPAANEPAPARTPPTLAPSEMAPAIAAEAPDWLAPAFAAAGPQFEDAVAEEAIGTGPDAPVSADPHEELALLPTLQSSRAPALQSSQAPALQSSYAPALQSSDAPAGRRNKAERHELTTFVGDRLIDFDATKRRQRMYLWASIAAGAVALSGMIFGVWYLWLR